MTKLTFNWARFCNYAHWDLIVNSRFYRKMALLMMSSMMTVILMIYLVIPIFKGFTFGNEETDPAKQVTIFMMAMGFFFSVIAMAYTFHSLLTKQSRILELTIPAATIERFVWHVLVVTVGTQLVLCASVAVVDLTHLILASVYGLNELHSIWMSMYVYPAAQMSEALDFLKGTSEMQINLIFMLSGLSEMTFLMMVSAWKYRYSVVYAIALKVAIGIAEVFLIGCLSNFIDLKDLIDERIDMGTLSGGTIALQVVIIIAEIVAAYWLFSRARVISRNNP